MHASPRRYAVKQASAIMSLMIFLTVPSAPLLALSVPSVGSVTNQIEKKYNINPNSVRDVMQSFNVSGQKKTVPEVSIFFSSSDPRSGEKLTAKAMPMYFSNAPESLYYTWYLKRKDCNAARCDYNNDGKYNSKDWRIEAAGLLAQNGYSSAESNTSYGSDSDDDGYRAHFGGDGQGGKNDYCAVYEPGSGNIYELANTGSDISFCSDGLKPVCLSGTAEVQSSELVFFSETAANCNTGGCESVGTPTCNNSVPACNLGTPCCVADPENATVCTQPLNFCTATTASRKENLCKHVFAMPGSGETGDGSFGVSEENFWKTDPNDPSTANNGKKDEANIVGLGADSFSWSYFAGDEVGVAVEGASILPTKHDDSSYYTMWAFPKNKCSPSTTGDSTGAYVENIKNYNVTFSTTTLDPNDCIEKNLVDPTEGGQATNLEVQVSVASGNLVNDETSDGSGDVAAVQASISNALQDGGSVHYDWTVEVSDNQRFSNPRNITAQALAAGLITRSSGRDLGTFPFQMNMTRAMLGDDLSGRSGYIRFRVRAEESFDGGGVRRGRGDVIVKFTSTGKRILAYLVEPVTVGTSTQVQIRTGSNVSDSLICEDSSLERTACRVVKNEIIGLKIDGSGLRDFTWHVNQRALTCTRSGVSPNCSDTEQTNTAFFPVTGEVGESYDISVTASNAATGEEITLSRLFYVVEPLVKIVSSDRGAAWPKLLGFYRDVLGAASQNCPSGLCPDYSEHTLQTFTDSDVTLKAVYIPSFIQSYPGLEKAWNVDGVAVAESAENSITLPVNKPDGSTYDISFQAFAVQSDGLRRALYDIWRISPLSSTELRMESSAQIEVREPTLAQNPQKGVQKYYALLLTYVPDTVVFSIRLLLLGFLLLFSVHFLGSFVPTSSVRSRE